jgi:hypothetical protein
MTAAVNLTAVIEGVSRLGRWLYRTGFRVESLERYFLKAGSHMQLWNDKRVTSFHLSLIEFKNC